MTTHSEDLISLEELQSMLAKHAGPNSPLARPAHHRVRGWRPVIVAVIAVVSLAGAGVAIAAGVGAFEGTPAPPDVSTSFSQLNRMADLATQHGFAQHFPQADVSKAHGVIEVQTPDGPEDLWAAPNDQGGQCYFIDWANDAPGQDGSKYGFGGCGTPATTTKPIAPSGPIWIVGHPDLMTLNGSVSDDAATVEITFKDGSTMTLPVIEHMFLGSIDKPRTQMSDFRLVKVTAFDANGKPIADWPPPPQ
jgi:hypothetical protein